MSYDLEIPSLIDLVDFRVTFTINGLEVTPAKVNIDMDKMKLPDLPSIPLPKLASISDPRNLTPEISDPRVNPRDPRRRLSQNTVIPSPISDYDGVSLWTSYEGAKSNGTPTRKKISLSDYRNKKTDKSDLNAVQPSHQPANLPVIYGAEE